MTPVNLRITGSILLLVGYFILIYINVLAGCSFRLAGGLAMIPYAIQIKTWDIVALQTFFAIIDGSKILQILTT